jgi:4-hydroxybenzoate polyprenyltransferase
MEKVKAFVLMLRPANLLMVAVTQLLIRFCVILPVLNLFQLNSSLSNAAYLMVVLATVLIAASGYIINDYFDSSIDAVNKPFKIKVNDYFSKQSIVNIHLLFNVAAIGLSFAAGWIAGNYKLSFIYAVAAGLLWFYSSTYKKMFLVGNLVVSVLTSLVVLLPVMFELPVLVNENVSSANLQAARIILYTSAAYFVFAFAATLIREIVKDMEDIKGDMTGGANTIPVVLGFSQTKILVAVLWLVLMGLVGWYQYSYYQSKQLNNAIYFLATIQLPSVLGIALLFRFNEPEQFGKISLLLKVIMFLGILSMGVFYLMSNN